MQMTIDLPATLSEQEVREIKYDLAVLLYQRGAASLGKAAALAGLTRIEFQRLLAPREVPINYSEIDLEADLAILRSFRRLSKRLPQYWQSNNGDPYGSSDIGSGTTIG